MWFTINYNYNPYNHSFIALEKQLPVKIQTIRLNDTIFSLHFQCPSVDLLTVAGAAALYTKNWLHPLQHRWAIWIWYTTGLHLSIQLYSGIYKAKLMKSMHIMNLKTCNIIATLKLLNFSFEQDPCRHPLFREIFCTKASYFSTCWFATEISASEALIVQTRILVCGGNKVFGLIFGITVEAAN